MTTIQVVVNVIDCYRLLGNGTVPKFEKAISPREWVTLDTNVDIVQVIAANTVCVRRKNREVYRHVSNSWNLIRRDTNKIWASQNDYFAWDQSKRQVLHENAWDVMEENPFLKDVAVSGNNVYQLRTDGQTYIYEGGADGKQWRSIDRDTQADVITATSNTLYKRRRNGQIFAWDATKWTVIGMDMRTPEFVAGDAGLFLRLNNGSIYQNRGPLSWQEADPSADNIQIAVDKFPYQLNAKGQAYRLLGNPSGNPINNNTSSNNNGLRCKEPRADQLYKGGYANNNSPIFLRIGDGAGDAFIKDRVAKGDSPFRVPWHKSDTTETIAYLKDGTVDVGITYNTAAEHLAKNISIAAKPSCYVFREHVILVGPPSNPAELDPDMTIEEIFSIPYTVAEAGSTTPPVRFLSRFDKSATNIKDSEMWIWIGQIPWATKQSNWYHQYMTYPIQALSTAAALQGYTVTYLGTYLSVDVSVRKKVKIYKKGSGSTYDPLLMPSHLLISSRAKNADMAKKFADWLTSRAGQAVIEQLHKSDQQVYTGVPII